MGAVHHGGVRDAEHQRHVGAGHAAATQSLVHFIRQVALSAARSARVRRHACSSAHHVAMFGVLADAAASDARILGVHAAEGEDDIGVLDDLIPADIAAGSCLRSCRGYAEISTVDAPAE